MIDMRNALQTQVDQFATIGHPQFFERFVLNLGEPFDAQPFDGERGTAKECFANATHLCVESSGLDYVEGFATRPSLGLLIHHAWCARGSAVVDPTWSDPADCFYFGVRFSRSELIDRVLQTKVYGLAYVPMLDLKWLLMLDPSLNEVAKQFAIERMTA